MKYTMVLTLVIAFGQVMAHADDGWQMVETTDGIVQGLLPGESEDSVNKESTLAGTFVTNIKRCQNPDAEFSVSSTKLSSWIRQFASDEKVYTSARDGLLEKYNAAEKSFDAATVDGVAARLLRYESSKNNCEGVALFFIYKNSIYSANASFDGDTDNETIEKFCKSIRINR